VKFLTLFKSLIKSLNLINSFNFNQIDFKLSFALNKFLIKSIKFIKSLIKSSDLTNYSNFGQLEFQT
jgi:hypothetical protein